MAEGGVTRKVWLRRALAQCWGSRWRKVYQLGDGNKRRLPFAYSVVYDSVGDAFGWFVLWFGRIRECVADLLSRSTLHGNILVGPEHGRAIGARSRRSACGQVML